MQTQAKVVIGLDVGTTGTKAAVCDPMGRVLGKAYCEYDLHFTDDGGVEQNAADWIGAVRTVVRDAVAASGVSAGCIAAISLSTQGGSFWARGENGEALTPVMTWMDGRARAEAADLRMLAGERLYRASGWQVGAGFDAAKLLWLRRNAPEVFDKAVSFDTTLETVNRYLTGRNVTDPTNAAIRILYNIEEQRYDPEILELLGLDESRLPEVLPTGAVIGNLTATAAEELGLPQDVAVCNGAHDQYCASLGAGAVHAGDVLVATGTAWVVLGVTDRLIRSESHVSPGIHPVAGLYGAMASLVSAGSVLKWYKNLVGSDYSELDAGALTHRESAKDLFFAPYLAGAGFPHRNPDEPAKMIGLKLAHDRYDIARALMEGVAFEVRRVLEEYSRLGCPAEKLTMTGRTAHSALWRGILRDVTGCGIAVTEEADTCCIGAAMLAAVGAGLYRDLSDAAADMARVTLFDTPDADGVAFYNEKYCRYRKATDNGCGKSEGE